MSDSPASDPEAADAAATDEPAPLGNVERGIASAFSSFERGILSFGDTRARPETVERPPAKRRDDRTYEAVLKPVRWRRVMWGFGAAVVLVAIYFGATLLQVWVAADNDQTRQADAIVVLGAAQFDGTPSPVFAARLDHALALYEADLAPKIVTTGSNQIGDRFTEGFSGYLYLLERGVPDEALIPIVDGGDSWEQLSATANQFDLQRLETALLVSDGYHSFRLLEIADEVGLDAYVSPTNVEPTIRDYLREATAVSIGRIIGYRRISAVN